MDTLSYWYKIVGEEHTRSRKKSLTKTRIREVRPRSSSSPSTLCRPWGLLRWGVLGESWEEGFSPTHYYYWKILHNLTVIHIFYLFDAPDTPYKRHWEKWKGSFRRPNKIIWTLHDEGRGMIHKIEVFWPIWRCGCECGEMMMALLL